MTEQELYHAWLKKGAQKEDHKYIRREWKNGRWVYYYDSDTSAKPKNTKVTFSKTNSLSDVKTTIDTGRAKYVNIAKGKLSRAETAAKKKIYETRGSNTVDTDRLFNSRTTISMGGVVIASHKNRGKLERAAVAGKEYVRYLLEED